MDRKHLQSLDLPDVPGVYLFVDAEGEILYIGKAMSLRARVRSYFASDLLTTRGSRIVDMVTQSSTVQFQETPSVLEALILEANLIRKHQPPANVAQKDDRSFNHVVITDEEFPRVFTERERILANPDTLPYKVRYDFGPYPSSGSLREALQVIRKIFPFRDRKADQHAHARFYSQLGLSPDTNNEDARKHYKQVVNHLRLFFQGKKSQLMLSLKREMLAHARRLEFEKAENIKRQLFALEHINDVSLIKADTLYGDAPALRIEGYDVAHFSGKSMVGVMTVVLGNDVEKSDYRKFSIRGFTKAHDTGALEEVLRRRFKHDEWRLPDVLVVDGGMAQFNVGTRVVSELGLPIQVVAVTKDIRHKPKALLGPASIIKVHKQAILLVNSEAHRFAQSFHTQKMRSTLRKQ